MPPLSYNLLIFNFKIIIKYINWVNLIFALFFLAIILTENQSVWESKTCFNYNNIIYVITFIKKNTLFSK
jgi:hypothetical protein